LSTAMPQEQKRLKLKEGWASPVVRSALLEWWETKRKAAKKKTEKKKSSGAIKHTNPILAEAAALAARQLEARKAREAKEPAKKKAKSV